MSDSCTDDDDDDPRKIWNGKKVLVRRKPKPQLKNVTIDPAGPVTWIAIYQFPIKLFAVQTFNFTRQNFGRHQPRKWTHSDTEANDETNH